MAANASDPSGPYSEVDTTPVLSQFTMEGSKSVEDNTEDII